MKLLKAGLLLAVGLWLVHATPAFAATTAEPYTPPSNLESSPVIVSSYAVDGARVGYVQLFNTSDMPVSLQGWQANYFIAGQSEPLVLANLSGWIAPSNYVLIADPAVAEGSDFPYDLSIPEIALPDKLQLVPSGESHFATDEVVLKTGGMYVRKTSASTGNYVSGYNLVGEMPSPLYGGGFYDLPETTSLQVSEILPKPYKCSPVSTNATCGEYVKLYNPSAWPVDLSQFRLRVGYQGQSSTSSNTYSLAGTVAPGHYATIAQDADGRPLSLTDSGSFVWLEDAYGLKAYAATVASYPSATSVTKEGAAWAYDTSSGTWKWTARPAPGNQPSVFVALPSKTTKASAASQLKPCKAGQYRSKETNRCRSLASATASNLTPCKPGQTRSPETNRCRKNATLASSLKPCASNQERNPETNRCRKKASDIPGATFAVEPVKETGKAFAGWWALGGVGLLAAGYGAWEWRHEALGAIRKVGMFAIGRK